VSDPVNNTGSKQAGQAFHSLAMDLLYQLKDHTGRRNSETAETLRRPYRRGAGFSFRQWALANDVREMTPRQGASRLCRSGGDGAFKPCGNYWRERIALLAVSREL